MKKLVFLLLIFALSLALFACGDDNTTDSSGEKSSSVDSSSTDSSNATQDSDTKDSSQDSSNVDSSSTDSSATDNSSSVKPDEDKPGDGSDNKEGPKFKVYLEYNGETFINESETPITVVWSDGLSFEEADANERGIATAEGLDGNYFVTLKNVPEGFTYNPNPYNKENDTYGYEVTNDNPETTIELFKIGTTKGAGSTEYNRTEITRTGVYRATLTGGEHKIFFGFAPKSSGTYTIESWVSVTDDKVNPKVDVYTSSFAAPIYQYTIDTGSAQGKNYTKNFKYEVEIADEMISSGGQVVFVFAIHATTRNTKYYPVNVDFAIKYNGGFDLNHIQSTFMVPNKLYGIIAEKLTEIKKMSLDEFKSEYASYGVTKEHYDALQDLSTAKLGDGAELNHFLNTYEPLRGIAVSYLNSYFNRIHGTYKDKLWKNPGTPIGSKTVLIGDGYKYNEATGFYHKYNEQLYADDPYGYGAGFGPILYADISVPLRTGIMDEAFTLVEYHGNKVLTVSGGTENYKLFIESFDNADKMSIQVLGGGIECDEKLKHLIGYASLVNSDGAVPVTEELKEFLQKYAINQVMFMDGDGWAERADNPYQSTENDQWLFACGYYE